MNGTTPSLESLLREQIAVDLEANRFKSQRDIIQRALGASFGGGSNVQPGLFLASTCGEVTRLGALIFEAMQKVLSSVRVQNGDALVDKLQQIFSSEFDPIIDSIRCGFGTHWATLRGGGAGADRLAAHARLIKRARHLDVRLSAEKMGVKDESKRGGDVNVTIHGSHVDLIQAGEGNSAFIAGPPASRESPQ